MHAACNTLVQHSSLGTGLLPLCSNTVYTLYPKSQSKSRTTLLTVDATCQQAKGMSQVELKTYCVGVVKKRMQHNTHRCEQAAASL